MLNRRFLKMALAWTSFASTAQGSMVVTPFLPQSFFFDWNIPGQPVPIPITQQCETIHINWARGTATGPDPTSPYYLQVYTSKYTVPFVIPAGNGLSFDWAVPFSPGTQYQICMFDKFGNTGGCQGTYTVIPPSSAPNCANVTFPPQLDVQPEVNNGPMSQFGWIDQCSDISLIPKNGTAPYTLTVAPALHPPYNITSPDTKAINWTLSLNWASPFFISLVDADGSMWANGPLHAGGGGTIACLSGNVSSESAENIKPVVAIGAGVGGAILGLLIGALVAWLFLRRHYKKKESEGRFVHDTNGPGSPQAHLYEEGGNTSHYRPLPTVSSSGAMSQHPSMTHMGQASHYQVEPFIMPGGQGHTYGNEPVSPSSAYAPSTHHRLSTIAHEPMPQRPPLMPATSSSNQGGSSGNVYVVHHDSHSAPVTIYHSDGTQVVELPPRYPPISSAQSEILSEGRSATDSRSEGSRTDGHERLTLHQDRKPTQIRKPARGP